MISTEHKQKRFTLIELIVVLSIMMILTCLLVPALKNTRSQLDKIECTNNLEQIGSLFNQYSADFNNNFPIPISTENGNYWSNVLYSLYISENGLVPTGMEPHYKTGELVQKYVDRIGFSSYGSSGEEGTIFHCPSAKIFSYIHKDYTGKYTHSYAMNPYLGGGIDFYMQPKLARIKNPSEGYLVMDCNNSTYMGGWSFWYYSSKTMETFHHDQGRNFLYVDGHVNYIDNADIPRWSVLSERNSFWQGL